MPDFNIDNKQIEALKERLQEMFDNFLHKPAEMPSRFQILTDHIIKKGQVIDSKPFKPEVDYFEVVVNQLFLAYQSRLWVQLDPTVIVNTQFGYGDKKDLSVPFLVGPSAMNLPPGEIPKGGKMVFKNTPVTGVYPYKGGKLQLSLILCQLGTQSYAKKIMKLVESIASAIDYSTQLSAYLKIAGVVVDGIEEISGITGGLNPIAGYASPFDASGYFALIDSPQAQLDVNELWVVDDELRRKDKDQHNSVPVPFLEKDYVLYSINGMTSRDDVKFLPFYPSFEKIIDDASKTDDASWKRAKTDMSTLYMTMYKSPDLTHQQALQQYNDWTAEMTRIHEMNNPKIEAMRHPRTSLTAEDKKVT